MGNGEVTGIRNAEWGSDWKVECGFRKAEVKEVGSWKVEKLAKNIRYRA
jgi:hypothetical protein